MSLAILETMFGSKVRARVIRFFLLNSDKEYSSAEVSEKTMLPRTEVSRELIRLEKIKFVTEKSRAKKKVFVINPEFPFHSELQSLVSKLGVRAQSQVFRKLKLIGEVKLILISGLFLNYPKSKADMILVVNNVNRAKLKHALAHLEAEVGREISFMLMGSEELQYRLNMLDRFLIEFLEGPYEEVVNRVPELKRFIAGLKK